MNKTSFLLLPTVLAVTSARAQTSSIRTSRPQSTTQLKDAKGEIREANIPHARKAISIDFVFTVNK